MTKDEEIRVNATVAELANANTASALRCASLAAEIASLREQLEEARQKKAAPLEAVKP